MSDTFPEGNVPHRFRGLQASLWAAHGGWWFEVVPAATNANERLRRPWRSVYRVGQLELPCPITWASVLNRVALLATEVASGQPADLIHLR